MKNALSPAVVAKLIADGSITPPPPPEPKHSRYAIYSLPIGPKPKQPRAPRPDNVKTRLYHHPMPPTGLPSIKVCKLNCICIGCRTEAAEYLGAELGYRTYCVECSAKRKEGRK